MTATRLWLCRLTNAIGKTAANTTIPEPSGTLDSCGRQLNASDTLKAMEPNPDEPADPNTLLNNSALPKDEEALWANQFYSSNKPWIDVPLDIQEHR
ncbi:hypothetical protein C0992_012926 [Termitomyces sp. T32_za158]|nr:hypothetical protein C0992_012926 [Termitomyces sp. T32_za158]